MSSIQDQRINSLNLYVESTFGEYLGFAKKIINNNQLQRKRVRTSKTVYSLLKTDLQRGCVIPPIVLAISQPEILNGINLNSCISQDNSQNYGKILLSYIIDNSHNVLILDGLQRTFTLIDADMEMRQQVTEEYEKFLGYKLRLEVYLNINKFGVLYRMLTLNTGQTPMSARHQLEMLYSDMLDTNIRGLKLVSDVKGSADPADNEFIFKNAVEGFNSYMSRNELPLDRQDLLENIKMLENMASEDVTKDLFKEFLECYAVVFNSFRTISCDHIFTRDELDEYEIGESPFGISVCRIFSTSQALTGFGAAVGKMKDRLVITAITDISKHTEHLLQKYTEEATEWIGELLLNLDRIKNSAKKIGNAQRMFFHYFFRELFNEGGDSFLNLDAAVKDAYNKYNSQVN